MKIEGQEKLYDDVEKYSEDEEVFEIYTKLSHEEIVENTKRTIAEEEMQKLREEKQQAHEEGLAEGHKTGLLEGEKNKFIEIAKKMLEENMDIDFITKITNLAKEEIEKL